jgi:hypothetical protein
VEFGKSVVEYRGSMVGVRAEIFVSHDFLSLTECTDDTEFFSYVIVSHRSHR